MCVFSSGRYKESRERKIDVINSDLYRYYGKKETFYEYLTRRPEIKYIVLLRKAQKNTGLLKYWYKIRLSFYSRKTQIDIPANTKIGEGLYLGHTGCRIINPNVIIGKNCNIATGVVIGKTNRRGGTPVIGNNVWIGSNAVIVGKIKIGNNVLIAPNAYVNIDVPDNSIVIGNPASIHHKENATGGYINNSL